MLWRFFRSLFFLMDAETAHRWTMNLLHHTRWIPTWLPPSFLQHRHLSSVKIKNLEFVHPVGLAAGMDKDAEILPWLPLFGFSFAEIGTVTPRPQSGNPRPRLWRRVEDETLFNRMGFNSMGAKTVANHLRDAKKGLPEWFRVGVNLGKNKETPNENAATDYLDALQEFRDLVDFVVINVSSPNTPGLRALQEVETLRSLYQVVKTELSSWQNPSTPIWIKLAPELEGAALEELLKGVPADAWVLTNTLSGEWQNQKGGWSGRPLKELSRDRLRSAIKVTQTPMVSVGGILSVEEAKLRLELGAALIEIYSGWVFRGPFYPKKLRSGLQKK